LNGIAEGVALWRAHAMRMLALVAVTFAELVYLSGSINDLLLAREEWMAL